MPAWPRRSGASCSRWTSAPRRPGRRPLGDGRGCATPCWSGWPRYCRAMQFAEVVARRRMVRHFAPEPVDRAVLERIAATAQRTPSAGFSQGQRLVIVTKPERMRRVAAIAHEAEYIEMGFDPWLSQCAALFIPCVSEKVYRDRY